jgi:hypothetical protein
MTIVNAEELITFVLGQFQENDIPITMLISNLSDSTNYMWGKKSGFETRLRQAAPHLLFIDGDVCHHIHNAVKEFCSHFDKIVEGLLYDLYTDFKWSADTWESFQELCTIMGVAYITPTQRVAHIDGYVSMMFWKKTWKLLMPFKYSTMDGSLRI